MRNSATTRGALHLTQLAAPLRACVAVAAVLLLAGCSSAVAEREAPPSSPASPQTQEPTPTPPTSTATYQPESRYGLTCGAVVDSKLVAEAFTVAVSAVDPLVTASGIGISIPRMTSILSLGGTVCEWSNGVAMNSQYGDAPSYVGLMFSITPPPDSGWSSFAAGHRMPGTWRTQEPAFCRFSALAGEAWVTLEASGGERGAIKPASVDAVFAGVIAAVEAAGPPRPTVAPRRDVPDLPSDCEAVLPLGILRSISGAADAEPGSPFGGGWSDWAEARLHAGDLGCRWYRASGDEGVASVNWVRDGRWAYERALAAGTFVPSTIEGLGAGDRASIRCDPASFGGWSAVDLVLGPDWLNVSAPSEATAAALAEAVVTQVSARPAGTGDAG